MAQKYLSIVRGAEAGVCPYCKSMNITYEDGVERSTDSVYYKATCDDCGKKFEEHYNIEFDGHVINE